jgi:starch synthase
MRVLFGASEIFPFAKTGGLADVAYALPKALSRHIEVASVMPMYSFMNRDDFFKEDFSFEIVLGSISYDIQIYSTQEEKLKIYFIHAPLLSTSEDIYNDANDDLRFGIFSKAIVELALHVKADTLHLNDWHTALSALFIKERELPIKTVFSIHNLAYQGIFDYSSLQRLGIDSRYFTMDLLEYYSKLNFMKAGIAFSDILTTVSPTYAKEILTKRFGCGLEGFLNFHSNKLLGILNGIDERLFDPANDRLITQRYDSKSIELKYINKKALLKEHSLKDPRRALFVMISRLVQQKGFDLLIHSLKEMLKNPLNFILLVDGESHYKEPLEKFAKKYDNFTLLYGYDESLSHRIYAGGDFLLMPSLFEPCGLNQMIAMRYGTIPIVHAVGGLIDSVHEEDKLCGRGIVFSAQTKKSFLDSIKRALKLSKKERADIITFNMECDFSFNSRAKEYLEVYS